MDIYRVNTPSQGKLNVQIQAEHAGPETNATVTVQLLNSSGGVLQTWTAPVGAASVPLTTQWSRTCTGSSTYYLRVSSSICLTSYKLTQNLTWPSFGNDAEPNQVLAQTVGIPPNTNIDGHLSFEYDNTFDGYRIYPATDGVLTVTAQVEQAGPSTTDSINVEMKNSSNQSIVIWKARVGANGVPHTSTFTYTCTGTESYYYIWTGAFPSACGISYRLNYSITPPLFADDQEPNNTLAQTPVIQPNTAVDGRLSFNYDNNFDGYRIFPASDGVLTLTVLAEHAEATTGMMNMELKSNSNTSIVVWPVSVGANGSPDTTVITYRCLGTQNFYYLFAALPTGCGVSYRFSYSVAPALFGTDPEPNSSQAQARITQADTPYDGHLNFNYDSSTDGNKIYAPSDGVLTLTMIAEHAGSTQDSLSMYFENSGGGNIATWRIPIGNNGSPDTTVITQRCTGNDDLYYLWILSLIHISEPTRPY